MIEVLIKKEGFESASKTRRLTEVFEKLRKAGWKSFGNNGIVYFFKDVTQEGANSEMERLGMSEFKTKMWEEVYYDNLF
jgi:hypothetical protein